MTVAFVEGIEPEINCWHMKREESEAWSLKCPDCPHSRHTQVLLRYLDQAKHFRAIILLP